MAYLVKGLFNLAEEKIEEDLMSFGFGEVYQRSSTFFA